MEEIKNESANLPMIGEPAPEFDVLTTHGKISLSQYRGKWLVLFSHPADFTPVCTTEFVAFSEIYPELQKINTELVGLSIDSLFSHIAWVRNIKEKFGVEVPFPIIVDLDMKVAKMYGMLHPKASSTSAVRAVFVIDDKGIIRTILYYPASTGRNMSEVLRIVKALQAADAYNIATPANWNPGDKVIVPPPQTVELAQARMNAGYECHDWYLCKKELV